MLSASTEPSPETAVAVPQPGSAEMPIDLEDDAALARHLQAQEYTVYNGAGVSAFDDGAAQLQIIDVTDSPPPASPPALPSRPESAPLEILHYQPGQPRTPSSADMPLLHARQPPGQSTSSPDAALPTRLSPRRAASRVY
ncbi:hypothetical protein CXG81DRAFT_28272 [Caulochytrium protostelioides]|uniref:Uncharacterized protein n=1 Tax=Caulochytrium protostelioides TaxID=1555241 RepID=A0A4P9X1V9_9FUNG|nr:hypothetical protein CXG81DRAFT_28272 [Caulochytrium protostelioides]|eukprot:RKO98938.1 hypothetical protein CXG81DRAFT_28272 [Caulochytrium protostelioides]